MSTSTRATNAGSRLLSGMGNEMMAAREIGRSTGATPEAHGQSQSTMAPGKSTLAAALPAAAPYIEQLKQMAGQRVQDGGKYVFEIQPDATFKVVVAPNGRGLGHVIEFGHPAWHVLCGLAMLVCVDASVAASPPAPAIEKRASGTPEMLAADEAEAAGKQALAGTWANSRLNANRLVTCFVPETPPVKGDVARYNGTMATIRGTGTKVPHLAFVRILEVDGTSIRIELLESAYAREGTELGWTTYTQGFQKIPRPARPSTPEMQMAAMLGAARGRAGGQAKNCFHNIKDAIVLAKGYGDILDFNADPRFDPAATFNGPQLHTAIQAIGPAGLGLEELPGPVENAPPGSLLITRGNGKNGIDMTNGDAAVIEGDNGKGVVVAYNDGRMELTIDHSWWAPGGRYENMLIAIYKPIARP